MAVPYAWSVDGTPADPSAHKTRHQDGGADEIAVTGLSGLLADDQHVLDAEVVAAAIAITTLTTRGDIIYRNATVPTRLAKGTAGYVLTMGADDPAWATPAAPAAHKLNTHDAPDGAVAFAGQQATNIVDHVVADAAARNALTGVVGKRVFQTDELAEYVCTAI